MVQLRIQGLSELGLGLGLGLGLAEVEWTQCSPKESLNVNTNIFDPCRPSSEYTGEWLG